MGQPSDSGRCPRPVVGEPRRPLRRRAAFAVVLLAAAAYGLAVFLASVGFFTAPAPAGQLAGYMTARGLDAAGPFRAMAALLLLPGIAALAARPLASRLTAPDSAPWVAWMAAGSLAAPLWARLASATSPVVLVACALVAVALLAVRRRRIVFSGLDLLLLPSFLVTFFSLVEMAPALRFSETALLAAAAVLLLRLVLGARERADRIPPAWCFSCAPAAHLLHVHLLHPQRAWAAPAAAALALGSVLALAAWGRWNARTARRLRWLLVYVSLPLFAFALPASTGRWNGALQVDTFEDGHHVFPAAEMLRGERLYRDVVPGHGALADGAVSWAAMRLFGQRLDVALLADHHLGALNSVAAYALGVAGTGSPVVGLMTVLFAQTAPAGALWLRTPASLAAVAFAMAAARRRAPRRLFGAGAGVVFALLTSLEMGCYAAAVVLLAIARGGSWSARRRALLAAGAGVLAVAAPVAILMAARGTLDDMLRVTADVLSLGPVYVLSLQWLGPVLRGQAAIPEVLRALLQPTAGAAILWTATVLATAAAIAASPWRGRRRTEPLLLLGAWVAVAGFSVAERHHEYFVFGLWPLLALGTAVLLRARGPEVRGLAVVAVVALLAIAGPTNVLLVNAGLRRGGFPLAGWATYPASPRAGETLFRVEERVMIERVRLAMDRHLAPGETFYDFVNLPVLYFLLDRPAPIQHPEVPFYQEREAQLEVIRRLQRDRSVRAVLVALPSAPPVIDLVPNCRRAPLVWRWLHRNFEPAHDRDGIVVWRRTEPRRGRQDRGRGAPESPARRVAAWRECR